METDRSTGDGGGNDDDDDDDDDDDAPPLYSEEYPPPFPTGVAEVMKLLRAEEGDKSLERNWNWRASEAEGGLQIEATVARRQQGPMGEKLHTHSTEHNPTQTYSCEPTHSLNLCFEISLVSVTSVELTS